MRTSLFLMMSSYLPAPPLIFVTCGQEHSHQLATFLIAELENRLR